MGALSGCATRAPIRTEAALGKVVVYRNGVAYFERRAVVDDGTLRLTVPADRVDDFLKSLKIVDAKTGQSLPVSFKTMDGGSSDAEMIISVPGKGRRELLVTYVTDSPSWKPSYRLELGKAKGRGQIEAWAVVDNVSGEDWKHVTIGVGSTSALSFKYDLHSVRLVERETLGDEQRLGQAPPTGGSPYAVASTETPVVGTLGGAVVDELLDAPDDERQTAAHAPQAVKSQRVAGVSNAKDGAAAAAPSAAAAERYAGPDADRAAKRDDVLGRLAAQINQQPGKVKLQGFGRSHDKDREEASLRRANAVRDKLIALGVRPDKLEAVGSGTVNDAQPVRVVGAELETAPQQPRTAPDEGKEPTGSAYFVAGVPMTIEKDRSAMVSLMKRETSAEQVYYYDPVSTRGSHDLAFQAVRIENPTDDTLDRGPFTVYAEGQFLGEGLSEPIPPHSVAFIPYALDRQVVVEPKATEREEVSRLVSIERGIVTAEIQAVHQTAFSVHNRGDKPVTVYVRHAVAPGWTLRPTTLKMERLAGTYLFPIEVAARSATVVNLEETAPALRTLDLHTTSGADSVGLYLKSNVTLSAGLRQQLDEVLALYRQMADVEQRISTLGDQMNEYRTRVNELNDQLVTLRKVERAQDLSRHLAKKMQEISDRLQKATLASADLAEDLMTKRISVQDRIAELTLDADAPSLASR
jgi:uncharacterized coiled-coil protein SlyX